MEGNLYKVNSTNYRMYLQTYYKKLIKTSDKSKLIMNTNIL
jgi:hypothetical protein